MMAGESPEITELPPLFEECAVCQSEGKVELSHPVCNCGKMYSRFTLDQVIHDGVNLKCGHPSYEIVHEVPCDVCDGRGWVVSAAGNQIIKLLKFHERQAAK